MLLFLEWQNYFPFSECPNLKFITIPQNLQLEVISESAFSFTKIKNIYIPTHEKILSKGTFSRCSQLKKIEFAPDSELEKIKSYAFFDTKIETITLPQNVSKLSGNWCEHMSYLRELKIHTNNR